MFNLKSQKPTKYKKVGNKKSLKKIGGKMNNYYENPSISI